MFYKNIVELEIGVYERIGTGVPYGATNLFAE